MEEKSDEKMVQDREEVMISLGGEGVPTSRMAHFLTPSVDSLEGPVFDLPSDAFSPPNVEKKHLKVNFQGWKYKQNEWKAWVDRMHSMHSSVWKQVGIHDAIMNSTYVIRRYDDLIYEFAARWCPETNTFVFPWGEATLTLEDMIFLGGFSVLGEPVFFNPAGNGEQEEIGKKLMQARSEISSSRAKKVTQSLWMQKFMVSGSEIEHEAFLTLWLSRFVFPMSRDSTVPKCVIPLAIQLARGIRIAIAPAVLASIYSNLSAFKKTIVASTKPGSSTEDDYSLELLISAPFQLVQIWVWERFPSLRPTPNILLHNEPRFAKWHEVRKDSKNVKLAVEDAAGNFQWRAYAIVSEKSFLPHNINREKQECILVASDMDEELEVFIRCLRVSELCGIDTKCIEIYLPNRVGMQFGMDQDLPGHVERANANQIVAWENYIRPFRDGGLYIPSCLSESHVTTRYLEWWKKSMSAPDGDKKAFINGVNPKDSNKRKSVTSAEFVNVVEFNDMEEKVSENKDTLADDVNSKKFKKRMSLKSTGVKLGNNVSDSPVLPVKRNPMRGKGLKKKGPLANGISYKNFFKRMALKSAGKKSERETVERKVENDDGERGLQQSEGPATENRSMISLTNGFAGQVSSHECGGTEIKFSSAVSLGSKLPILLKECDAEASINETSSSSQGSARSCKPCPSEVPVKTVDSQLCHL